jgi:2,6-dihydroxypyridine 3-monooxygenase
MQVAGFTQDEHGVTVLFANGQRQHCDLLVCADGIRSTGRRILLPSQTIRYAGYVAWRGVVAADQLDPALVELFGSAITYYVMPHSHLLIYPIPVIDSANGTLRLHLNWLWYRNVPAGIAFETLMTDREGTARDLSLPAGMVQPHKIEQLHDDASALPPPITQLLRATERPFIQAIVDLEIPQMAFGRICLIGDAAWVARPHAAAGSAKAAADAWQLGVALRAANFDVLAALQRWEPAQLELGQQVLARTRAAGQRAQFDQAWQIGDPLPFGLYAEGDSEI